MRNSPASRALIIAVMAASVAYPFAVFFGLDRVSPRVIGTAMTLLILVKLALGRAKTGWSLSDLAWIVIGAVFLVLLLLDDEVGVRFYPVLVNFGLAAAFGASLRYPPPIIERIARLRHPDMPPAAVAYVRQVTKVWLAFFLANGLIAGWTAIWGTLAQWTLYNGLISYIAVGLLFAVEFAVRQRVRRAGRMGP